MVVKGSGRSTREKQDKGKVTKARNELSERTRGVTRCRSTGPHHSH